MGDPFTHTPSAVLFSKRERNIVLAYRTRELKLELQ